MLSFEYCSVIDAPVERVFAFHESPGALRRLTPPWTNVEIVRKDGGIEEGASVELMVPLGPFRRKWVAVHTRYEKNRLFEDVQKEGPFRHWRHRHEFTAQNGKTKLTDHVEFSLPGAPFSDWLGGWMARRELKRMFQYRHETTRRICESTPDFR